MKDLQKHVVMIGDQHSIPQTLCVKDILVPRQLGKCTALESVAKSPKKGWKNLNLKRLFKQAKLKS
jgi:hypothetical protein